MSPIDRTIVFDMGQTPHLKDASMLSPAVRGRTENRPERYRGAGADPAPGLPPTGPFISNSMSKGCCSGSGSSSVMCRSIVPLELELVCTTPGGRITMEFFDACGLSIPYITVVVPSNMK